MANEMVVLQGQTFTVDLQSRLGSTNHGWVLTGLAQGVALVHVVTRNSGRIGPTIQTFMFGAISATENKVEIEFSLVNFSDFTIDQKYTVAVKVIPSDSEEFVKMRTSSDPALTDVCNSIQPYGVVLSSPETVLKYGYPCGVQDSVNPVLKYGYPNMQNTVNLKYGYPCGAQDSVNTLVKYGYPCGVQDVANVKYGYPRTFEDASVMYGFRCDNTKG